MGSRLAIVVPTLRLAGAERVAVSLAESMAKLGHDVLIVTYRDATLGRRSCGDWTDEVPKGCRHVHLRYGRRGYFGHVVRVLLLARILAAERCDGVVSFLTYSNLLTAVARRVRRLRFAHVASEHNDTSAAVKGGGWRIWLQARGVAYLYSKRTVVVCVSRYVAHDLRSAGFVRCDQPVVVIYNPVDADRIRRSAQLEPANDTEFVNSSYLVVVARLVPQKGQSRLLDALSRVSDPIRVLMVGDGPSRADLESKSRSLGLTDRICFTGWLDNPMPVIRKARGVILPSEWEGFGLTAIEAAIVGTPFLGSDTPGLKEACEIAGLQTFALSNDADLDRKLTAIWRHPEQFSPKPMRLKEFDAEIVAARYVKLCVNDVADAFN